MLALPCGLACAGSVVPGLDDVVTAVVLGLAALALLALAARWVARWVRERREDRADAITAARWRAEHAPHLLTAADRAHLTDRARPARARDRPVSSRRGLMWGVTGWALRTWLRITVFLALGVGAAWLWCPPGWFPSPGRRRADRAVDPPRARPRMVLPGLRHLVVDPMNHDLNVQTDCSATPSRPSRRSGRCHGSSPTTSTS